MHIVILGGAGFVGSHLAERCVKEGWFTTVIDNLERGKIENLRSIYKKRNFQFIQKDAREIEAFTQKPDIIVNLVAHKIPRYSDALSTLKLNVEVAEHAMKLALRYGARLVLVSTSDVYGKSQDFPLKEDGDLLYGPSYIRRWAYAVSKLYTEHLAYAYGDRYGLNFIILRYFGIYGPRLHLNWWGGPVGVFIDRIYKREEVEIHGTGQQKRSFIYISDIIEGTVRAMLSEIKGEIINLGTEEEISIIELAEIIAEFLNRPLKYKLVPYKNFTQGYEDPQRRLPSIEKAKRMLGFSPKFNLKQGLKKTIDWYLKELKNGRSE